VIITPSSRENNVMKKCSRCGEEKFQEEFHCNRSNPDGLCRWCKTCNCNYAASLDKEVLRARRQRRRAADRGYRHEIRMNARRRALDCGVPFNLTLDTTPLPPAACPCCGRKLDRKGSWDCQPSLDRIFPEKGYTQGNIHWLCRRCNVIKTNASPEELMQVALYVMKISRGAGARCGHHDPGPGRAVPQGSGAGTP
jgi:hypothetical protein